jgi:hypothetical protein
MIERLSAAAQRSDFIESVEDQSFDKLSTQNAFILRK